MPNKLPKFLDNHKICIICEGNEEYEYLKRLKDLKVWNEQYDISLVNAGGNGNIPARYQDRYQNGADEIVLVFCDTEKKPHEQYEDIKRKINEFHGVDNAADEVIIFGNPCTMQIISKHWIDENLKSAAKKTNAPIIKKYTGVENYKGREDQGTLICVSRLTAYVPLCMISFNRICLVSPFICFAENDAIVLRSCFMNRMASFYCTNGSILFKVDTDGHVINQR